MRRSLALDGLNFCLADSAAVLGPFLGVFLLTQHHWDQAAIGLVAMIGGLTSIAAHIPIGALIDATHRKRGLLMAALVILGMGALAIAYEPTMTVVVAGSIVFAIARTVLGPSVTALTLGLFQRSQLAVRMGRNSAFDHAGNVAAAVVAGAVGSVVSQRSVFMLVPLFSLLSIACVLAIPSSRIDHQRARGADEGNKRAFTLAEMAGNRPLLLLAACLTLFHFANAAMLPLVGQRLALAHAGYESAMMSFCIVAAQLVMLPIALLSGAWADRIGRKPVLLAAFAVLPLRGLLYTLSDAPVWLIGVQLLDGIGAGIIGVIVPLLAADLTRGTGRFNVSLSAIGMLSGIGAAVSNLVAGVIVVRAGYDMAFLALAASALLGLLLAWRMLPETAAPAEVGDGRALRATGD